MPAFSKLKAFRNVNSTKQSWKKVSMVKLVREILNIALLEIHNAYLYIKITQKFCPPPKKKTACSSASPLPKPINCVKPRLFQSLNYGVPFWVKPIKVHGMLVLRSMPREVLYTAILKCSILSKLDPTIFFQLYLNKNNMCYGLNVCGPPLLPKQIQVLKYQPPKIIS